MGDGIVGSTRKGKYKMKKLKISVNTKIIDIYGTQVIGNVENGSFIALTNDGEELINRIKKKEKIDVSKLSEELQELVATALDCDILTYDDETESKSINRIDSAYLHVTYFCNYKCIGCYSEDEKRNKCSNLGTEQIKMLMRKLSDAGIRGLMISGGEPFLRTDIVELLKYAKVELKISRIIIGSNGTRITNEIAEEIAPYVDDIKISIDGYDESIDFIRDKGATEIGIRATKILKRKGINVSLLATLHRGNYKYINSFLELSRSVGVPIAFSVLTCDRNNESLEKYVLDGDEFCEAVNSVDGEIKVIDTSLSLEDLSFRTSCGAGERTISVDADGSVYPCHMLHMPELRMGNLLSDTMNDIMESEVAFGMKQTTVDTIEKCGECNYRYFCGGGCRARVYLTSQNMKALDIYCESYYSNYDRFGLWLKRAKEER